MSYGDGDFGNVGDGDVRLVGGEESVNGTSSVAANGILEIFRGGGWCRACSESGTSTGSSFLQGTGGVMCRQLGFSGGLIAGRQVSLRHDAST